MSLPPRPARQAVKPARPKPRLHLKKKAPKPPVGHAPTAKHSLIGHPAKR